MRFKKLLRKVKELITNKWKLRIYRKKKIVYCKLRKGYKTLIRCHWFLRGIIKSHRMIQWGISYNTTVQILCKLKEKHKLRSEWDNNRDSLTTSMSSIFLTGRFILIKALLKNKEKPNCKILLKNLVPKSYHFQKIIVSLSVPHGKIALFKILLLNSLELKLSMKIIW